VVTIGAKEGLGHLALATLGPEMLSCPRSRPIHPCLFSRRLREEIAFGSLVGGGDFFQEATTATKQNLASPKDDYRDFPYKFRRPLWWT